VIIVAPTLTIGGSLLGEKAGKSLGKLIYKVAYE